MITFLAAKFVLSFDNREMTLHFSGRRQRGGEGPRRIVEGDQQSVRRNRSDPAFRSGRSAERINGNGGGRNRSSV